MIAAGTRLGPYEITAQIGAGGMGEVYRGRDSRLDRTVAIKVLPSRFSSDATVRERFEREARAISALSHPHICTLYDIGNHGGVEFLVMEYLEGESLETRLARGALPIDQVLRHGVEIARALEQAHKQGIVHRDLKPGNIVLTKSGAKLLDFGLAKFALPPIRVKGDHDAPTEVIADHQKPLTEDGTVVGTFQYMAPEQLEGTDADARTDIFSLGLVLYEMATGRRAFGGGSRASIIAAIMERQPASMSSVMPVTPRALERIVQTCMAKDPDERWQSAHDVAVQLRWLRDAGGELDTPEAQRPRRRTAVIAAAIALAAALSGAAAMWLAGGTRRAPAPLAHVSIPLPPEAPLDMQNAILAISPDGSRVAWAARYGSSRRRLYVRSIHDPVARAVPGTDGLYDFAFSPDGRSIAFTSGTIGRSSLKRLSLDGGAPVTIIPVLPSTNGLSWHGDTIYYARDFTDGIWGVSVNGGAPKQIAKVDPANKIKALVWPHVLPDGATILATAWTGGSWDNAVIVAVTGDGKVTNVVEGGTYARYLSTGHLLFGREGSLMAVPFDPDSLRIAGRPKAVLSGIGHGAAHGEMDYAVSASGHLVYAAGGLVEPKRTLVLVDGAGNETAVVPTARPYSNAAMAPDGSSLAVSIEGVTLDVWLLEVERDLLRRLSFGGDDTGAAFTADGQSVIWQSSRSGVSNLYRAPVDGSAEERLTTFPREQRNPLPSPDGKQVVYSEINEKGDRDIRVLALDTLQSSALLATPFDETPGAFSPDGRWLCYTSNESGRSEVYVRPFQSTTRGKWQVSIEGGRSPAWSRDGREIYYRSGTKLLAAPIETSPRVHPGRPRLLLDRNDYVSSFEVAPDGRLLMTKERERVQANQVHLILNWGQSLTAQ